jgi:hypothetical protein
MLLTYLVDWLSDLYDSMEDDPVSHPPIDPIPVFADASTLPPAPAPAPAPESLISEIESKVPPLPSLFDQQISFDGTGHQR